VTVRRNSSLRRRQIATLIDVCHRLAAKGFVAATDGNVSIRLPGGNILITCSGISKGMVDENDFVEVTPGGKLVASKRAVSTEVGMHAFIYRERPDVHAVVHAHPPTATGFAVAHIPLEACLLPEVVVGLGAIPLASYATPSTDEVAQSISPFVRRAQAILLANHGVVTFGRDPLDAFFKMEKVEHAAQIALVARMLGGAIPLSEEELEKLRRVSVKSYGVSLDERLPCRPGHSATRAKN
jgi:L-fuculose-phosphate aldolase